MAFEVSRYLSISGQEERWSCMTAHFDRRESHVSSPSGRADRADASPQGMQVLRPLGVSPDRACRSSRIVSCRSTATGGRRSATWRIAAPRFRSAYTPECAPGPFAINPFALTAGQASTRCLAYAQVPLTNFSIAFFHAARSFSTSASAGSLLISSAICDLALALGVEAEFQLAVLLPLAAPVFVLGLRGLLERAGGEPVLARLLVRCRSEKFGEARPASPW